MRWIRFQHNGTRIGYLTEDRRCVQPVDKQDLLEIIRGQTFQPIGDPVGLETVQPAAPLRPGKIIAVGLNYRDHCREQNVKPPKKPILFAKFPTSVIGPDEAICWPRKLTEQVDFEVELAVIIGQHVRALGEAHALDAVFAYAVANDISARDLQFEDGQWLRGKALDTFCPLGPVVLTPDEVPDPQALPLRCRVNGVTYQDSNTNEMIFPVRTLLAFISQAITLEPGDLILTGTPHGVGVFRDPQIFLHPDDVVEVEVGDFGVLRNPIGGYL